MQQEATPFLPESQVYKRDPAYQLSAAELSRAVVPLFDQSRTVTMPKFNIKLAAGSTIPESTSALRGPARPPEVVEHKEREKTEIGSLWNLRIKSSKKSVILSNLQIL